MDPDRWNRLSQVFHDALEQEAARRSSFLDQACGDDLSLRGEVESLLAYHESGAGLLGSHPPPATGRDDIQAASGDALTGRRFGHYVIQKKLGQGGMGMVFLATDTRLGRPVAIKALVGALTQDARHRERLRREARAVAALTHPAVAMVYALEEFDSNLYIISEYVPGVTLRDEISRGPAALAPLLETAVEIASALTAAHEAGVVHRDLKPENVMRTLDGGVKVLDFGLARLRDRGRSTTTRPARLTETGAVLGTLGYMPPEQLRGAEVDSRADMFAFGVLLYELASGVHPFASSTAASSITRVLEEDPPSVRQLNPACSPALDEIIQTCLQKEPEHRFGSTRDLWERLEQIRRGADTRVERRPPDAPLVAKPATATPTSAVWWWQFHQVAVGLVYYSMLYPLWKVRAWVPGVAGSVLFFCALAAVGVAANVRFHLWFTSRSYPAELTAQRRQASRWLRAADLAFVVLLLSAAGAVAILEPVMATLLVAVAIGSFLAFVMIEPATTRAAFRRQRSSSPGTRTQHTRSASTTAAPGD